MRNKWVVFDFETYDLNNQSYLSVWGAKNSWNNDIVRGLTIQEFINYLVKQKSKLKAFAHNFAKFDGMFILKALNKCNVNGHPCRPAPLYKSKNVIHYNYSQQKVEREDVKNKRYLEPGEYTVTMDDGKKIYEIALTTTKRKKNGKGYQMIRFWCSWLIFGGSIAQIGHGLGIEKLKSDYTFTHYKSIEDIPEDKLKYLDRDVEILHAFISKVFETRSMSDIKMTSASTAYRAWQKSLGVSEKWQERFKFWKGKNCLYLFNRRYSFLQAGAYMAKELFPTCDTTTWYDLKKYYNGGITYVNPFYQGIRLHGVTGYDINSSYPNVMVRYPMPYGKPFKGDGGKDYPLKLYKITYTQLDNKEGLPFVYMEFRQRDEVAEWTRYYFKHNKTKNKEVLYLTTPEFKEFKKYYTGDYTTEVEWSFKSIEGREVFGDHVDTNHNDKKKYRKAGDYVNTAISKMNLNSTYGKFGSNIERDNLLWIDDEFVPEKTLNENKYYIPLAIFITAYARMELVKAVEKWHKYMVYTDTDSLVMITKFKHLFNFKEGEELGEWKEEFNNNIGTYRRPKQNMRINEKDEVTIKYASIQFKDPKRIPSFEKFVTGCDIGKQLRREITLRGVSLQEYVSHIPHIASKHYIKNPEMWFHDIESYHNNYESQWRKVQDLITS